MYVRTRFAGVIAGGRSSPTANYADFDNVHMGMRNDRCNSDTHRLPDLPTWLESSALVFHQPGWLITCGGMWAGGFFRCKQNDSTRPPILQKLIC